MSHLEGRSSPVHWPRRVYAQGPSPPGRAVLIPAVLLADRHRAAADAPTARSTPASRPPGFRPGRAHIAAPPDRPIAWRPGGRTRGRAGRRSPRSTGGRRRLCGRGWWLRRSPAQHARPSRRGTRVQGPRFSISSGSESSFRPSKPPDGRPGFSRLRRRENAPATKARDTGRLQRRRPARACSHTATRIRGPRGPSAKLSPTARFRNRGRIVSALCMSSPSRFSIQS